MTPRKPLFVTKGRRSGASLHPLGYGLNEPASVDRSLWTTYGERFHYSFSLNFIEAWPKAMFLWKNFGYSRDRWPL